MKKFLKFLPWILLVIACIVIWAVANRNSAITSIKASDTVTVNTNLALDNKYIDSAGSEHSVYQNDQNLLSKDYLKSTQRKKNFIDTVAKTQNIAVSEIERVTKILTLTQDSFLKAKKVINAQSKQLSYLYSDAYVKLKFTPPLLTDTVGAGTFDFAYNADLTISQFFKRKWFLGAKKSFIDISSTDSRTTIRGVKQLTIEQKSPQFGLRVQGSANYNPQTGTIGIGPAVRLDFGRFSVQGNYLYYPQSTRWRPGIIGNFDIVRF